MSKEKLSRNQKYFIISIIKDELLIEEYKIEKKKKVKKLLEKLECAFVYNFLLGFI